MTIYNYDMLSADDIDSDIITRYIPTFMDSLYDDDALRLIEAEDLRDLFHTNQVKSKAWMLNKLLHLNLSSNTSILIIGSWVGFLTHCLHKLGFRNLTEVDLMSRNLSISQNLTPSVIRFQRDINTFADINNYDVIINTSCEHIKDDSWFKNINPGSFLMLQSNNFSIPTHTNICRSISEMVTKYPMKVTYYGVLRLNVYERYMSLGNK